MAIRIVVVAGGIADQLCSDSIGPFARHLPRRELRSSQDSGSSLGQGISGSDARVLCTQDGSKSRDMPSDTKVRCCGARAQGAGATQRSFKALRPFDLVEGSVELVLGDGLQRASVQL